MRSAFVAVTLLIALGVAAYALLATAPQPAKSPAEPARTATPVPTEGGEAEAPEEIIIMLPVDEQAQAELRYLPQQVSLADAPKHPMLERPVPPPGEGTLEDVTPLTSLEKDGHFLNPRLSPDGLQVLMTRPGEGGLYVMSLLGGEPVLIADVNGFNATWTEDGRIAVAGEGDMVNIYGTDGLLEEARYEPKLAFGKDDTIYVRPSPEEAGRPITAGDDRYYAPILSPDGTKLVFSGLYTGIYVTNADGSGRPIYLGTGNNPTWLPDGSGVVFDDTTDDGHVLLDGRIVFGAADGSERTPLTPPRTLKAQRPTVGRDGRVLFEADGTIYSGRLRLRR